jgi:hypothetical protein
MFGRRPDRDAGARALRGAPLHAVHLAAAQRIVVYFEHTLDAESALAYLDQLNASRPPDAASVSSISCCTG